MSSGVPPPPPPGASSEPSPSSGPVPSSEPVPSGARSGAAGWKVATAVATVMGLALSGTVYLLMDRQADELRAERDAAEDELAQAQEQADGGLGGLEDLLSGDGGLEDLLGEGGLGDLLGGEGGLGDLLGMGDIDPILFECLGAGGTGVGEGGSGLGSDGSGLGEGGSGLGGDGSIPDADVETQVEAIQEILETERGLPAGDDIDIEFVSLDEVQRRAVDLTAEELDPDEAAIDSRILASLGAVEAGTDLAQAQLDALDAGVGGFYDPETEELVIGSEEMDGLGVLITSHELVHALADAAIGLPDQEAVADEAGSDAAYAALNAIEGDASLYSQQFIGRHLPFEELLALQATSAQTTADLDELPHFVARQLEFPYVEGMTFTCDVFLDGGWDAVDATYTELPTTTAQILFPDRYRDGEAAVDVRDPAGPSGWDQLRTDTFGAADLLFLLEAPGDDESAALSDPKERVGAWAGGEITVWGRGDETATALVLADRGGATSLCETVTDFYAAAFPDADAVPDDASPNASGTVFEGPEQSAVVSCDGDEVALGTGPDVETARAAIP